MIGVRINEAFQPQGARLGERNGACQDGPCRRRQKFTTRVFGDQAMVLGRLGILVQTIVQIRRDGEEPAEKPHRRGHTGYQPAQFPQF